MSQLHWAKFLRERQKQTTHTHRYIQLQFELLSFALIKTLSKNFSIETDFIFNMKPLDLRDTTCLLVYVSLIQVRIIWEEGLSIKKMAQKIS